MMKQYLGDSVYADIDREYLVLTTEDGANISNKIFLEPEVLDSLLAYITAIRQEESSHEQR